MTTPHDPLCPRADIGYLPNVACWCDEIARDSASFEDTSAKEALNGIVKGLAE